MFPRAALLLLATLTPTVAGCLGAAPIRSAPAAATIAVAETTADGGRRLALVRRSDFLVAPVTIDGQPAGEFLVDTGAGATFIDRAFADALHLPRVADTNVQGALFTDRAEIRELHRLVAGGVALVAAPTLAIDLDDVRGSLGDGLTGIIGFPTIGPAPFTIDFEKATLTIHDPARFTPPAGVTSELLRVNQVPYVEATLENGVGVWLQLDTGSVFGVTLWRDFVKAHPDVLTVPQKRWVQGTGIGGGAQIMESEIRTLHVLGRDYSKVPVVIHDAPPAGWHHPRVAGRVGIGLMKERRVTIHPVMRRIWVEP